MKAICTIPVQLYDEGLTGLYSAGQILEGEQAAAALALHPDYFMPAEPAETRRKKPVQEKE